MKSVRANRPDSAVVEALVGVHPRNVRHHGEALVTCILGIDYGSKRIGLAMSDGAGTIAMPMRVIEASGDYEFQAAAVWATVRTYPVKAVVIGLPLNMDGSEGPQAKESRLFGDALSRVSGTPVHYWDERLSSFAAEEKRRETRATHRPASGRRSSSASSRLGRERRAGPRKPPRSGRKAVMRGAVDHLAAQDILQRYLEALDRTKETDSG